MQIKVHDNSDKDKVLNFISIKNNNNKEEYSLISTYPPNLRSWLKSSGIYDRNVDSNRKKCDVFESLIDSSMSLVLISSSLPNCEARLSFDLITLVLTETNLPMVEIENGIIALTLGDSLLQRNSRIVVIQSGEMICYLLNFEAIFGLNEHINIDFDNLISKIDLYEY